VSWSTPTVTNRRRHLRHRPRTEWPGEPAGEVVTVHLHGHTVGCHSGLSRTHDKFLLLRVHTDTRSPGVPEHPARRVDMREWASRSDAPAPSLVLTPPATDTPPASTTGPSVFLLTVKPLAYKPFMQPGQRLVVTATATSDPHGSPGHQRVQRLGDTRWASSTGGAPAPGARTAWAGRTPHGPSATRPAPSGGVRGRPPDNRATTRYHPDRSPQPPHPANNRHCRSSRCGATQQSSQPGRLHSSHRTQRPIMKSATSQSSAGP